MIKNFISIHANMVVRCLQRHNPDQKVKKVKDENAQVSQTSCQECCLWTPLRALSQTSYDLRAFCTFGASA